MRMMVAKTAFSKHSSIVFSAFDKQRKLKLYVTKGKEYANQRYIKIEFHDNGIEPSQALPFQIEM